MPGNDLDLLIDAAQQAGRIATGFFDASAEVWDKPDNAGPVTEADLAVDRMLRSDLLAARPDYGWLSEETEDDPARLETERQFIVDPIDGTRAFINKSRDWSHSLAIAENGIITHAVVFLPLRDELYSAALGHGAHLNGAPICTTRQQQLDGATVLAARPNMSPEHWQGNQTPPMKRHFRSSLAYRLSLVGAGRFDAMLTLRPSWEWDIAAGGLIVQEASGTSTDRTGQPLRYNNPHPMVNGILAAGAVHSNILAQLA